MSSSLVVGFAYRLASCLLWLFGPTLVVKFFNMTVSWHKEGTFGFVELCNPPVNSINQAIRKGLSEAVAWAESEHLTRVILSGAGLAFAAGADVGEFDAAPKAPHLPDVLNDIESSKVPWIAALHGAVLGGGAELALACRCRVARPNANIGFPEVILGIVPGAGGTQRLPRLVGMRAALKLIPVGESMNGTTAKQMGLVDLVYDDPVAGALQIPNECLDRALPACEMLCDQVEDNAFDSARQISLGRMRGQDAPLIAIDLLYNAQAETFTAGMKRERAAFLTLRQSFQARALRHIFFAERSAKKIPVSLKLHIKTPDHVVVVGGGTMGTGIAYALLRAGCRVTLLEPSADGVKRACSSIEKIIKSSLSARRIDAGTAKCCRNRLKLTTAYTDLAVPDLAIEAVTEDLAVKQDVLSKLQAVLSPDTVLATNTSYLDVDVLADALADPSRLIGLHFFAPAYVMNLLEIVKASKTSSKALAMGYAMAKRVDKVPVIAGVCDGFIGNRILARYREAADTILIDGGMPWDIDRAMVGFGYAMGPYESQDLSGLDIAHAQRRRQDTSRDPTRRYIAIADRVVAAGRLGRKTGSGWYRHLPEGEKEVDPVIETLVLNEAERARIVRQTFSVIDMQSRLLAAMINEAANILYDGIAKKAVDIDLVTVNGYGFPRWRGGLMYYADQIGVAEWLAHLRKLALIDPVVWKPSPVIIECVEKRISLADWRS